MNVRGVMCWLAAFVLGTTNNVLYVVIGAASESIAVDFDKKSQFALINVCNVLFGSLCRAINATVLAKVPFAIRTSINVLMMFMGLLGVVLGYQFTSFPIVLIGVLFIGSACSFGESFMMNNLQMYPPMTVSGWSSGTGWAGVAGASFYLGVKKLVHSNQNVTFTLVLVPVVYAVAYFVLLPKPDAKDTEGQDGSLILESPTNPMHERLLDGPAELIAEVQELQTPGGTVTALGAADALAEEGEEDSVLPKNFFKMFVTSYCHFFVLTYQLTLVYFLEYVIVSLGAARAQDHEIYKRSEDFWVVNQYAVLNFCYQVGVFMSRSSLQLLQINHVWVLTFLQSLNFALWMANAYFHFLPLWSLFPLMVFVGLMGGASYVNIFYLILKDKGISEKEKALGINITTMHIDAGVLLGNLFTLLMTSTIFHEDN